MLYKVLELHRNCTDTDIKKAYHRLALQFHPDKNKGNEEAARSFMKIASAYELLSDPKKRRDYDALQAEEEKAENEKKSNHRNNSSSQNSGKVC